MEGSNHTMAKNSFRGRGAKDKNERRKQEKLLFESSSTSITTETVKNTQVRKTKPSYHRAPSRIFAYR